MDDERTPLLGFGKINDANPHEQFCMLAGVPPSNKPNKNGKINPKTLYGKATSHYHNAKTSHAFMASLSNMLLLSQVVLGAALTALGASESSHVLITLFGATNTIIAGLVAYLKSRGQPMRTRMYRDDLERVVDEIENSETMWLGISENIHGYDEIDVGAKVTVRSEVARLMRLYERAIRSNMMNSPDNYLLNAGTDGAGTALRNRPGITAGTAAVVLPQVVQEVPAATQATPAPAAPPADIDESPASAPPKPEPAAPPPAKDDTAKTPAADVGRDNAKETKLAENGKETKPADNSSGTPAKVDTPATNNSKVTLIDDPDASPATTDPQPKKDASAKSDVKPTEEPAGNSDKSGDKKGD